MEVEDSQIFDLSTGILETGSVEDILNYAEQSLGLLSLAKERAEYNGFAEPTTPEEHLFYLEDELMLQVDQCIEIPEERPIRIGFASVLGSLVAALACHGLKPVPPTNFSHPDRWHDHRVMLGEHDDIGAGKHQAGQ